MELFLHQVLAGLATGGIYACMALAVVMIYRQSIISISRKARCDVLHFIAWQAHQWGVPYWLAFGRRS